MLPLKRKRNRQKAAACLLIALSAVLLAPMRAAAEEWVGSDFRFTVPEEVAYTFTPITPQDDPAWTLAGIADPAALLEDYEDMGVLADFRTADGRGFKVMQRSSGTTEELYDLKDLSREKLDEFLDGLVQAQSDDIQVEKDFFEVDGRPFYRVRIDGAVGENEAHELICGTVFNGHSLNFDQYGSREIGEADAALMEAAVGSVTVTRIVEKPAFDPTAYLPLIGMLFLLLVIILSPVLYIPLHRRFENKRKAEMARRLSEFRKTIPDESAPGEALFRNETACDAEAVRSFSRYHAYGKNLPSLLVGAGVCALALAMVFLLNLTWWLKALALLITVFFLYRAFTMGGTVERVQRKVFGRGISTTARYVFYENCFRVSGVQSPSLFPYFTLRSVRQNGKYLYLYYGRDNAYLLNMETFTEGDPQAFRAFLNRKMEEEKL